MAKFKVGQTVKIKETGKLGVIKGREIKSGEKENHIEIQYVVKLGNGIENWKAFNKKEIESLPKEEPAYPKEYIHTYEKDDRQLILFGVVEKDWNGNKTFSLGYSIKHPSDENNYKFGVKIARKRAYEHPIAYLRSLFKSEFQHNVVKAIMDAKSEYIFSHLENFTKE